MHTKHSNTVFPGDNVRIFNSSGKVASLDRGQVIKADPDSGKVKVAYDDGREDWIDLDRLEKV